MLAEINSAGTQFGAQAFTVYGRQRSGNLRGISPYAGKSGVEAAQAAAQPLSIGPVYDSLAQRTVAAEVSETYVVASANMKLEHIATFKVGAGFLAAGFAAVLASFVVRAPFLIDLSAISTIIGGLIAAGAAEKYQRGE